MELRAERDSDVDNWKEVTLVYNSALKQRFQLSWKILNDEFGHVHSYNPIEHIKSRIKTSESIVKKLRKHGHESTIQNMVRYVNDIAGIRVICSFTFRYLSDCGHDREPERYAKVKVSPSRTTSCLSKPSGYKSYHMLCDGSRVPVGQNLWYTKVEIQIRTVCNGFLASLEHKINYKFCEGKCACLHY